MNAFQHFWPTLLLVCSTACSGQSGGGNTPATATSTRDIFAEILLQGQPLPACETSISGKVYFSQEDQAFYYCAKDQWTTINLKGKDGSEGTNGADGKNGSDGSNGTNGTTGARGPASLTTVYDANDKKIGWLLNISGAEGTTTYLNVLLTNGLTVYLSALTGSLYNPATTSAACHYTSNDCTGPCYANGGDPGSFVRGYTSPTNVLLTKYLYYYVTTSADSAPITVGSYSNSGFGCVVASPSVANPRAVANLNLESGATFPYASPLKLKPE